MKSEVGVVADPETWEGAKKHEISATAFDCHLLCPIFTGQGGMAPLSPPPGSATGCGGGGG